MTSAPPPGAAPSVATQGPRQPPHNPPIDDASEMLYIDPDPCIDCNLCVDECPATAIFPQADLPAEWAAFIEKNAAYYKK